MLLYLTTYAQLAVPNAAVVHEDVSVIVSNPALAGSGLDPVVLVVEPVDPVVDFAGLSLLDLTLAVPGLFFRVLVGFLVVVVVVVVAAVPVVIPPPVYLVVPVESFVFVYGVGGCLPPGVFYFVPPGVLQVPGVPPEVPLMDSNDYTILAILY